MKLSCFIAFFVFNPTILAFIVPQVRTQFIPFEILWIQIKKWHTGSLLFIFIALYTDINSTTNNNKCNW